MFAFGFGFCYNSFTLTNRQNTMQNITSTNTLIVTNPIMSPLFIAQLITAASYNKLCTQAQQDISVVAYSAAAYLKAMRTSVTAQANVNVVYNVTKNLSYNVAV